MEARRDPGTVWHLIDEAVGSGEFAREIAARLDVTHALVMRWFLPGIPPDPCYRCAGHGRGKREGKCEICRGKGWA